MPMRFFSRRSHSQQPGSSASASSSGGSSASRHVYPGQRTVVRGNAVPPRGVAVVAGASAPQPAAALSATTYHPGQRPGGPAAALGASGVVGPSGGGGAAGAGPRTTTTTTTTVTYPSGTHAAAPGPATGPRPHHPPQQQVQQQVLPDGRRVVRYTQQSAAAPGASVQQHHTLQQQQQQQANPPAAGGAARQGGGGSLMGPAGSLSPGSGPISAAGGGLVQGGLQPGGAAMAGSAPPVLGGAPTGPMNQQHYHPQTHSQGSAPAGGGGTGSGGGGSGSSPPQAQTLSGPGAYSISRNDAGPTQVFRVTVPPGVAPNQEFQVYAGSRVVRVRCPPDTRPGQSLQITVPPDPVVRQNLLGMAVLTSVLGEEGGGAVAMRDEVRGRNEGVMREEREREERRGRETRERATRGADTGSEGSGDEEGAQEVEGGEGGEGVSQVGSSGSGGSGGGAGVVDGEDGDAEQQDEDDGPNPAAEPPSPTPAPPPQPQAYMVTVPPGVRPGGHFPVMVAGQQLMVQCPHNARPGMNVRIVPPVVQPPSTQPQQQGGQGSSGLQSGTSLDRAPDQGGAGAGSDGPPRPQLTTQMFEVIVPAGVRPNQPFALIAGGQRVLVTCPPNAYPGQKIRFQLPVSQPSAKSIESVKLSYDGMQDGWIRTVRVTDMKFQWVRMDDKGDVDTDVRFDMRHSAYVRKLAFLEGNDPRMRTGYLSLVPASEAAVDSRVVAGTSGTHGGREIVGYADLAAAQGRRYEDKARWFQDVCARLTNDWNEGHMRINVRRPYLLQDSMSAVMSLGRDDLRKIWRFEFMGEAGIDAGGLAREWFHLVTEQIFDPDNGLWMSSSGSQQMYMRINPASEISCPEDHLVYFRFLGRVMGKALFDRQLVSGHMVRHMYKHLLGWPIGFDDLELFDEEYYHQLKKLGADYDDISVMCLNFTVTEDALGIKREVDLIPQGSDVEVTNDNLPEYLEANLKYRMLDRIRPQLTELLLGFFDVIPEPLLTIFDYQELELLMCGLPVIDVDDWMTNTNYTGSFEGTTANGSSPSHLPQAVRWFWEAVRDDFDQEMRARLLQFVTGTSGVPSRGFSVLQGNDGNIRKFTVHGVDPGHYHYPRAHTCFNRIDLPMYSSKEELLEKLRIAVSTSATGFDIE